MYLLKLGLALYGLKLNIACPIDLLNPGPAEPGYTLPLQTV